MRKNQNLKLAQILLERKGLMMSLRDLESLENNENSKSLSLQEMLKNYRATNARNLSKTADTDLETEIKILKEKLQKGQKLTEKLETKIKQTGEAEFIAFEENMILNSKNESLSKTIEQQNEDLLVRRKNMKNIINRIDEKVDLSTNYQEVLLNDFDQARKYLRKVLLKKEGTRESINKELKKMAWLLDYKRNNSAILNSSISSVSYDGSILSDAGTSASEV